MKNRKFIYYRGNNTYVPLILRQVLESPVDNDVNERCLGLEVFRPYLKLEILVFSSESVKHFCTKINSLNMSFKV